MMFCQASFIRVDLSKNSESTLCNSSTRILRDGGAALSVHVLPVPTSAELLGLLARLPRKVSCQQCRDPLGGQWFGKVISLAIFALQFFQQGNLLNCLYPLGNYIQPEIIGHGQNGPCNLHAFSTFAHAADEGAVNLQSVKRKTVQVTQR